MPSEYSFTLLCAAFREIDALERPVDPGARIAAREAGPYLEVCLAGQIWIEARLLDDAADALQRRTNVFRDLVATHADRSAAGPRETEHAADQCRLAGSVRPEPADAAPRLDLE